MSDQLMSQSIRDTFRENVRNRWAALGLTQTDLARRLKVSQPYVATIEAGRRVPLLTTVEQFAEALDCTVLDLLTEGQKKSDLVA